MQKWILANQLPIWHGLKKEDSGPVGSARQIGVFDVMIQKSGLEKKELSNVNIQLCSHEFCRPFSFDSAPGGHRCEWCGEPAEKHVTAIGGTHHNQGGFLCLSCSETFCANIANALGARSAER